jgi:hypothetical protein
MESFALPLCAAVLLFTAMMRAAAGDRASAIGFVGLGTILTVASMLFAGSRHPTAQMCRGDDPPPAP